MYPSGDANAKPLQVAICGAGIAGFAAAAAFRRQGHIVEIFESSAFSKEVGAAVGVPPNATLILKHLGYSKERARAVDYFGSQSRDCSGEGPIFHAFARPSTQTWGNEWMMVHRVDLHNEIRYLATGAEGKGTPAKLHLSTAVESCDPEKGILTLANGRVRQFDLIVGADGIYSKTRTSVLGKVVEAPIASKPTAAFRWVMPVSALEGKPELDWLLKEGAQGGRVTVSKEGHFLLCYPCRDKTLINSIAIHLDKRDQTKIGRNVASSKEELLEEFKCYAPKFKAWMELAEGVRIWQLRTMPVLDTWVNGRTCLIGDAAHAMFPTLGQGAAMVLEDSVVLAGLIPLGTRPDQINQRLRAYEGLRKERGEFVARQAELQAVVPEMRGTYSRSFEMQDKLMFYDAPKVAAEYYQKHFASKEQKAPAAYLERARL
ncbi:FAD/NAD(P)-binding domain-containing protein [Pterulicium gracile]|uniref:FAD/NAD(P)-binding domain-containing protein n=1 Tax=Pterulicium gracile TaxID=1884261 RepID=A0A5C3Q839_9AGAR|nr:FAD/NAD(P)-binding domain-containing protein [Pterula gracilis]